MNRGRGRWDGGTGPRAEVDSLEIGSYGQFAVLIAWQHSRGGVQVLGCDLIPYWATDVLCGAGMEWHAWEMSVDPLLPPVG